MDNDSIVMIFTMKFEFLISFRFYKDSKKISSKLFFEEILIMSEVKHVKKGSRSKNLKGW